MMSQILSHLMNVLRGKLNNVTIFGRLRIANLLNVKAVVAAFLGISDILNHDTTKTIQKKRK